MLKIGLTGGIGSGKSTVCDIFQSHAIKVIDADIIARQLVTPGKPALEKLVDAFGCQILDNNGNLDRAKLREQVFLDHQTKQQLENIMHPLIYQQISIELEHQQGYYCIVAIPLLFETNKQAMFDRVLVIDSNLETQISRVIDRNQLNREQVLAIIASQYSREQRLALADDIIDNSSDLTQLAEQIKKLHNFYLLLATARNTSA